MRAVAPTTAAIATPTMTIKEPKLTTDVMRRQRGVRDRLIFTLVISLAAAWVVIVFSGLE